MNILMLEWNSFGNIDIKEAFEECGHYVKALPIDDKSELFNDAFKAKLTDVLNNEALSFDFVFSFNYFPIVAVCCKENDIKYVSWIYDNPYVLLYDYSVIFPTNYIFTFDKSQFIEFRNNRIDTVYYLPLAVNAKRIMSQISDKNLFTYFANSKWKNQADISFIGSLYLDNHQFYKRLTDITPYTRGYLEGLIATQRAVYGDNFIQDSLSNDIIKDMYNSLPMDPNPTGCETREFLYAQYVINRHITSLERTDYLNNIAKHHSVDLYTKDILPNANNLSRTITDSVESVANELSKNIINHGPVDYYDMAPFVFNNSKINLNISLRSIKTGIPLRCFDIIGAKGFLLTNYQPDFEDCFIAGEDYVYFENSDDLQDKIDYYLTHENERKEICENGHNRAINEHSFINRAEIMLETIS